MNLYFLLKIIHVISASILFGTGMGTAFYMFYVNCQKDIELVARATKQVVTADWLFTGSSGVIQAITGFGMIATQHYAFSALWVWGSILGYLIAGACWLPVVWLQIRCRNLAFISLNENKPLTKQYYRYFKLWCLLGIPAFLSLVVVYYLMSNKITY